MFGDARTLVLVALTQGSHEAIAVGGPPPTSAVEFVAAPRPIPEGNRVWITSLDVVSYNSFDEVDRVVESSEQLRPAIMIQSVGVGDESQARWPVRHLEPKPGLIEVVVDWHAEAGHLSQVIHRAPGSRELEVDQGNGDAIAEHDVGELRVVVTDDGAAIGIGEGVVPAEVRSVEIVGGMVQAAQQSGNRREGRVGLGPQGIRHEWDITIDEDQTFAPVVVDSNGCRCSLEPGVPHGSKKSVD